MNTQSPESAAQFSGKFALQAITPREVQMFRDHVLRLGKADGQSVYRGDEHPTTSHLGAFVDNSLVAIATICHEAMPDNSCASSWRLRGMATLDFYRGKGLGKALAETCILHARQYSGTLVWCKARQSAVGFYHSLKFEKVGNPFPLPKYSDELYFFMKRPIVL